MTKVLVQWEKLTLEDATWEPPDEVLAAFPDFHLRDKVVLEETRDDTSKKHEDRRIRRVRNPLGWHRDYYMERL